MQMQEILRQADEADITKGASFEHLWNDDDDYYAALRYLAEETKDPRHVATVPIYNAHVALTMEFARKRTHIRQLLAMQTAESEAVCELGRLIRKIEKWKKRGKQ
jgi:hypothetical protein